MLLATTNEVIDKRRYVRYWHKADIQSSAGHVRFWG
jgi:hypothetical protein